MGRTHPENSGAIRKQEKVTEKYREELDMLTARVGVLEKNGARASDDGEPMSRANLTTEYMLAQRSVRLWPIKGMSQNDMWGDVGEFLHGPLGISEDELCQDDIENIRQAPLTAALGPVHDEVIVTYADKEKRDLVMG